jgi:hypothetical protein
MIEEENPAQPLSDVELASKLARDGVRVARRTVSKYRAQIKYPAAELRRAMLCCDALHHKKKPHAPVEGMGCLRAERLQPASGNETDQHHDNRDDDQDVYEPAQGIGRHQPEQPQDQENYGNGIDHGVLPSFW